MFYTSNLADKVTLLETIKSKEGRKSVVVLRNHEAQMALTSLQEELDTTRSGNPVSRQAVLKVMIELAKRSGQFPSNYMLSNVSVGEQIAGGGYGDVHEGSWCGKNTKVQIALKTPREILVGQNHKAFCQEALLWRQLSHKNILPFLGLYLKPPRGVPMMVSPWMCNGNILQYLKNEPKADKFQLLVNVGEGLAFLHQLDPPVIHSDLKPENILIDDRGEALLSDFGSTRVQHNLTDFLSSTNNVGTEIYMSPEFLKNGKSTKASDIWALGMVIYQVFTGQKPYQEFPVPFIQICQSPPILPSKPKEDAVNIGFSSQLWDLEKGCWAELPENRPTAESCRRRLKDLGSNALPGLSAMERA